MATRLSNPFPRFFNDNAALLASGTLTFYEPGSTTVKKDTFSDIALSTANTNPVELSKGGVVPDIFLNGTYRIVLANSSGGQIDEADNVGEISDPVFGNWSTSVSYGKGGNNIVTGSDGAYYVSISASNLGNDPTSSTTKWTEITFVRVWNTNETYAIDDIVRGSDGKLYRALVAQSGNDPQTDETNWLPIGSLKYEAAVNYFIGDVSQDTDNEYYMSIDDTNVNNDPSSTLTKWTRVRYIKLYNANETYETADVVQDSVGKMWRSLADSNTGNTPGSSPSKWAGAVDPSSSSSVIRSARTSNIILGVSDNSTLIDITANSFTQTFTAAATLASGWFVYYRNSGTGEITLDPNSSETIDDLTTFIMYPGETRLIQSDGTNLNSIVISGFNKTFTSSGTFTKPPGYQYFKGRIWGGGGSGQRTNNVTVISLGGGGGGAFPFEILASDVGTTEAVTIASGGAVVTTVADGNDGGTSSFGTLFQCVPNDNSFFAGGSVANIVDSTGIDNTGGGLGFEAGGSSVNGRDSIWGGSSASNDASTVAGSSVYGGAAGGSLNASAVLRAPGTSDHGGNGGVAVSASNGVAGMQPGGGGGATQTGDDSGAGADGQLEIRGDV